MRSQKRERSLKEKLVSFSESGGKGSVRVAVDTHVGCGGYSAVEIWGMRSYLQIQFSQ